MQIVPHSRKRRLRNAELANKPFPFVPHLGGVGVDDIVEVRVGDVDFFRVDADDGVVFVVELADVEGVLAFEVDVVVEFVPVGSLQFGFA